MSRSIRTVIADPNQDLVAEMVLQLQQTQNIEVVGTAYDGPGAAEICYETWPDIVVLSLNLPVVDGVKTTQSILDHNAQTGILIIALTERVEYILEAIKMGAKGYLPHAQISQNLIQAVNEIYDGGTYLPSNLAAMALDDVDGAS